MSAEYKVTKGIYTRKYQAKNIWEVGGACMEKQRKFCIFARCLNPPCEISQGVLHGAKWPNFAPWRKSPCEMVFSWLDAVVFRRLYLPHFSSKSYTVWSVGFLNSWALKWYIVCKKWTSESAPKVRRKTAAAVLCFPLLHCSCLCSCFHLKFKPVIIQNPCLPRPNSSSINWHAWIGS